MSLKAYRELAKPGIAVANSLSTLTGAIIGAGHWSCSFFIPAAGVLLLAAGSGALNHIQEVRTDALMHRTAGRPLPTGKTTVKQALVYALILILAGTTVLWVGSGWLPALLGLLSMVWYNFIYTPLKKVTVFALILGSFIGAIPPAIGWAAVGRGLGEPALLAVAFLFFMWQVPHFCLLLLKFGPEYTRAGFPALTAKMDHLRFRRITFVWTWATVVSSFLLYPMGAIRHPVMGLLLLAFGLGLILPFRSLWQATADAEKSYRPAFMAINLYLLGIMAILVADVFLR